MNFAFVFASSSRYLLNLEGVIGLCGDWKPNVKL